jgi:Kdo-III transferase WaaZ
MISSILKLVYRYSHTAKWRHNERLWPHARIERDGMGAIERFTWRGRPVPLARRADLQRLRQAPCHIIASGPSIADIDYEALPMHHVMGVNGAIALTDRAPVRFNYYCILDAGFVRLRPDLARRIVARDLVLFVTPVVLARLLEMYPASAFGCRFYLVDDIFKRGLEAASTPESLRANARVAASAAFLGEHGRLGFSFDIDNGFFHGGTVAYFALQVATWLGFTELYLHGVDLRDAAHTPRFYETMQTRAPTRLDAEFADLIEPSFRHASEVLRARGVRVENLSSASALGEDIFPKVDWRSLRRRNLSLVVPGEAVEASSSSLAEGAGVEASPALRPTGTH